MGNNKESKHNVVRGEDLKVLFLGFYNFGLHCLEFLLKSWTAMCISSLQAKAENTSVTSVALVSL